jgi:hypothetical protein
VDPRTRIQRREFRKMANKWTNTGKRWKIFYDCTCPEEPPSRRDRDLIEWYMHHINNCPPRKIETVPFPAYVIEDITRVHD